MLVLLVLDLAMFADVLVAREPTVVSRPFSDMSYHYLHERQFGFEQLRQGNLALWNPHVYAGVPFFGSFQSALLYPPNWLYMLLPLHLAVNVGIMLHVLLLGLWVYLWGRGRGLSTPAALLAAVLMMFGGAHFMHVDAGTLSNLCTMTWVPLLLLAVDACFDRPAAPWVLLGALAAAMMVLAGHPQYVVMTAMTVAIYATLRLAGQTRRLMRRHGGAAAGRWALRTVLLLATIGIAGAALSGVQLLTGLEAAAGSVRQRGLSRPLAGMLSFPPENFLMLLAPTFFGDGATVEYWGKWYRSEMTLFMGVAGLVLAVWGAVRGRVTARGAVLATIAATLVLALGENTPLFALLYEHVPTFNRSRGLTKFIFFPAVFMALLAGAGLDDLAASRRRRWWPEAVAALAGLAVLAGAAWIQSVSTGGLGGPWHRIMLAVDTRQTVLRQVYVDLARYGDPVFVRQTAGMAAGSLAVAAALLLVVAVGLALSRRRAAAAYALALLAAGEVFIFATQNRATFQPARLRTAQALGVQPGDEQRYRVLNMLSPTEALSAGLDDVWGSQPDVRRRYAELVYFIQQEPVDQAWQDADFRNWDRQRLYAMLRLKYMLARGKSDQAIRITFPGAMERLNLVPQWRVLPGRDAVFAAMLEDGFDPRRTVLLESPPGLAGPPAPAATQPGAGTVELVESSTDYLVVHAELSTPAVLLITDAYDPGWRAHALPGSVQAHYTLMPANHALQAVPLTPGSHRIRIEYRPAAFAAGKWISIAALALYAGALGLCARSALHRRRAGAGAAGRPA